ncbi:hypothetical protein CDO73_08995 [Saccharibacillus sp. O23]|nr:hypothetical protein CDO73_08995 [Saccharibacillus sp. O23]
MTVQRRNRIGQTPRAEPSGFARQFPQLRTQRISPRRTNLRRDPISGFFQDRIVRIDDQSAVFFPGIRAFFPGPDIPVRLAGRAGPDIFVAAREVEQQPGRVQMSGISGAGGQQVDGVRVFLFSGIRRFRRSPGRAFMQRGQARDAVAVAVRDASHRRFVQLALTVPPEFAGTFDRLAFFAFAAGFHQAAGDIQIDQRFVVFGLLGHIRQIRHGGKRRRVDRALMQQQFDQFPAQLLVRRVRFQAEQQFQSLRPFSVSRRQFAPCRIVLFQHCASASLNLRIGPFGRIRHACSR